MTLLKAEHPVYEQNSVWDIFVIGCAYKVATFLDTFINPTVIELYHPFAYRVARFALWSLRFLGWSFRNWSLGHWP